MIRTTLLAAAALCVSSTAHAATLTISNGFFKDVVTTSYGYSFNMGDSGIITKNGVSKATSLSVSCTLNTSTEDLGCVGTMGLGTSSTPVSISYDGGSANATVSIPDSAGAAKREAIRTWTREFIEPNWLPFGEDEEDDTDGPGGGGGTFDPPVIIWEIDLFAKRYTSTYNSDVVVILDGAVISSLWW